MRPVGVLLEALRGAGWSVAVHNDYRINGEAMTFWLFTHPCGRWIKGEGRTDAEALTAARAALAGVLTAVDCTFEPTDHALGVLIDGGAPSTSQPRHPGGCKVTARERLRACAADMESGRVAASPALAREHAGALRALAARIDEEVRVAEDGGYAADRFIREVLARLDADLPTQPWPRRNPLPPSSRHLTLPSLAPASQHRRARRAVERVSSRGVRSSPWPTDLARHAVAVRGRNAFAWADVAAQRQGGHHEVLRPPRDAVARGVGCSPGLRQRQGDAGRSLSFSGRG